MTKIEQLCCFLGVTKKTWYNWKDEKRPLVDFILKYIPKEYIKEFLETGRVKRLDRLKELEEIEKKYIEITKIINQSNNKKN